MSSFDKLAKEWDLNKNRVKNAISFANNLKEIIPLKDKRVIDYGAGTGLITFLINDDAKEVLALDNSKGMLGELEKKIEMADAKNVKIKLHDIHKDEMPRGFDIFVSSMTMHHIKSSLLFIKKAKESIKKGGYIAIADLVSEDGSFHSRGNEGVYHFGFDQKEIEKEFEEVGLRPIYNEIVEVVNKGDKSYPIFLIVGRYD